MSHNSINATALVHSFARSLKPRIVGNCCFVFKSVYILSIFLPLFSFICLLLFFCNAENSLRIFFFKWSGDYYNDDNESLIIILASSHLPFLRSPNVTITFHLLSFFSLDISLIRRITNALFGFNVYPFFLWKIEFNVCVKLQQQQQAHPQQIY